MSKRKSDSALDPEQVKPAKRGRPPREGGLAAQREVIIERARNRGKPPKEEKEPVSRKEKKQIKAAEAVKVTDDLREVLTPTADLFVQFTDIIASLPQAGGMPLSEKESDMLAEEWIKKLARLEPDQLEELSENGLWIAYGIIGLPRGIKVVSDYMDKHKKPAPDDQVTDADRKAAIDAEGESKEDADEDEGGSAATA